MYHLRCISLLTFCFDNLSIGVSGVLKCPTIILLLQFLLLCLLVFVLCFEVFLCWVYRYLKLCVILLDLSLDHYVVSVLISYNFFILRSMLSDTWIATPAFFFALHLHEIFFHPLIVSQYVSLGHKWVSCRQHIYGSYFCIHSANMCLLVGAFNTFTFKVIIDIYVPIDIL